MPENFLNELSIFDISRDYNAAVKHGRFSLLNTSFATLTAAGVSSHANLELRADFCMAGRNKRLEIVDNFTNFTGINRKYITDSGYFDAGLALEEFARLSTEKRVVKEDTLSIISKQIMNDSHELYLYNMLTTWLHAHLYTSQRGENNKLQYKTVPYEDAHIVLPVDGDKLAEHTYTFDLGLPCIESAYRGSAPDYRNAENYFSKPYVLKYNGASDKQEAFYIIHIYGRNRVSSLNYDHCLPGLNPDLVLLDPINTSRTTPHVDFDNVIPYDQPDLIFSWILDYVKLNRVEQHFGSALELIASAAAHPMPSSAEACAWVKAQLVSVLPAFSPTRARIKCALTGEPYYPEAASAELHFSDIASMKSFLQRGAITNYLMWYGLYVLTFEDARTVEHWRAMFAANTDNLFPTMTPGARAMCVSNLIGQEVPTLFGPGCGFYIDSSPLREVTSLTGRAKDGDFPGGVVPINAVYAPVSGALFIGALSGNSIPVQHLKAIQSMVFNDFYYLAGDIALQLANAYRLFGYELTLEDPSSKLRYRPWAPVEQLIIEPASVIFDPMAPDIVKVISSQVRAGRSIPLPPVNNLLRLGNAKLVISKPNIKMNEWRSRKTESAPMVVVNRKAAPVEFKIKSGHSFMRTNMTAKPIPEPVTIKQDFRVDSDRPTPAQPQHIQDTQLPAAAGTDNASAESSAGSPAVPGAE